MFAFSFPPTAYFSAYLSTSFGLFVNCMLFDPVYTKLVTCLIVPALLLFFVIVIDCHSFNYCC